jgi:hypothetical protein
MKRFTRRNFLRCAAAGASGVAGTLFLQACAREGLVTPTEPTGTDRFMSPLPPLPSETSAVAALVKSCKGADAKSVFVMDFPFGGPRK